MYEVCWAEKLTIGSFSIVDVPVRRDPLIGRGLYKDLRASLGLFALTRLDVITDWKNGSIYIRPSPGLHRTYPHNRLGAVFVPGGTEAKDLVAHVVGRGPAHEAGVRSGDVLLKIDELDATKWRTDPRVLPLHRFWSRPKGTEIRLALRRDEKLLEITVKLRDILQQKAKR